MICGSMLYSRELQRTENSYHEIRGSQLCRWRYVFWCMTPCRLVNRCQHLGETYCFIILSDPKLTSLRLYIPEDLNLKIHTFYVRHLFSAANNTSEIRQIFKINFCQMCVMRAILARSKWKKVCLSTLQCLSTRPSRACNKPKNYQRVLLTFLVEDFY